MKKFMEAAIEEAVFVGVNDYPPQQYISEDSLDIKSEPESDNDNGHDSIQTESNGEEKDQNISDVNDHDDKHNVTNKYNHNSPEEHEPNKIKEEEEEGGYINYEYLDESLEKPDSTSNSPKIWKHCDESDEDNIPPTTDQILVIKPKSQDPDSADYSEPYETENNNIDNNCSEKNLENPDSTSNSPKIRKYDVKSDGDYVPPPSLKISVTKPRSQYSNSSDDPEPNETEEKTGNEPLTIQLENYVRSSRIGRCIFDDCIEDCVSLIPRTVRRKVLLEYNIYIPLLSRVCKEHLEDQNWDYISTTTRQFRAEHCQDMKSIVTEAARTNFYFENMETVDSKLVRYWFGVNKGEFNRIFDYFPKLKRLKEPKTAFAVYLMHLQNTSVKRISLLLQMSELAVKTRISFVKNIVNCDTYKKFQHKFLKDDGNC